jgi:hypothetical protein
LHSDSYVNNYKFWLPDHLLHGRELLIVSEEERQMVFV